MATIEENLERIANSLAALQEVQLRLLDVATWNKERLEGKDPAAKPEPTPTVVPPAPAEPASASDAAAREAEYNGLKEKIIARGVEVKKGTKLNTLRKMWTEYCAEALLHAKVETLASNVETSASNVETSAANVETSAPAPVEPEKAPEAEKPLTPTEARKAIMDAGYNGQSLEKRQALCAALEQLGAQTFGAVPVEKLRDLVALYKVNAGVANA